MHCLFLFATIFAACGVVSSSIASPCKLSDISCLEKMMNDLRPIVFSGSPEHGIESSDPLFVKKVAGEFPGFKYKLCNSSLVGTSDCVISNLKIIDITKNQVDFNCPKFNMTGKYALEGHLLGKPVKESGDYIFTTGKYFIRVKAESKLVKGTDGKTHVSYQNFELKMEPREPVNFDFGNLFNGQTDLVDAFTEFTNENWEVIAESMQGPVLNTAFQSIFSNINKHLEFIALEDVIADFN